MFQGVVINIIYNQLYEVKLVSFKITFMFNFIVKKIKAYFLIRISQNQKYYYQYFHIDQNISKNCLKFKVSDVQFFCITNKL